MSTADEIAANNTKRKAVAGQVSDLISEMFALVKRGHSEGIPVPELARLAGVTRGRIYQILSDQ